MINICDECKKNENCKNKIITDDMIFHEISFNCPEFELKEELKKYIMEKAYDKIVKGEK